MRYEYYSDITLNKESWELAPPSLIPGERIISAQPMRPGSNYTVYLIEKAVPLVSMIRKRSR